MIVLTGKDIYFVVGADINELNAAHLKDQFFADYMKRLWYRIISKIC